MDVRSRSVLGHAELRSLPLSAEWTLTSAGSELAKLRRFPRQHLSSVQLADGTVWTVAPQGWGTVVATDTDGEVARITRKSWWGRRWAIESVGFAVDLESKPRPRHWALTVGGQPIADLRGSLFSYNKVSINTMLNVPLSAVVLAWQVIARPWEQAAHPLALVPGRERANAAT